MKQQIEYLDSTLSRRNAAIKKLEDDLKSSHQKLAETEKILNEQQAGASSIKEMTSLQNESQVLVNGANAAPSGVSGVIIDPQVLKVNEMSMTHLNKLLINKDADIAKLKTDIDGLKTKNDILREEKYKLVESLRQMENNVKSLMEKSENALKAEFSQTEADAKQKLIKLLPNCHLNEKSPMQIWVNDFVSKMNETQKSTRNDSELTSYSDAKASALVAENANLKFKNQTLKNMLRNTDNILQKMEMSVENSETRDKEYRNEIERLKIDTCNCLQEQVMSSVQVESQLHSVKDALEEEKKRQSVLIQDLRDKNELLEKGKLICKELSAQVAKWKGTVCENNVQNSNVSREVEELRQKLQRKDELLEREININKQLNNKLTCLGAFCDK